MDGETDDGAIRSDVTAPQIPPIVRPSIALPFPAVEPERLARLGAWFVGRIEMPEPLPPPPPVEAPQPERAHAPASPRLTLDRKEGSGGSNGADPAAKRMNEAYRQSAGRNDDVRPFVKHKIGAQQGDNVVPFVNPKIGAQQRDVSRQRVAGGKGQGSWWAIPVALILVLFCLIVIPPVLLMSPTPPGGTPPGRVIKDLTPIAGTLSSFAKRGPTIEVGIKEGDKTWLFTVDKGTEVYLDNVRVSKLDTLKPSIGTTATVSTDVYAEPNTNKPFHAARVYFTSTIKSVPPARSQPTASAKPAFFAVGQVWNVEMSDSETIFRGTLQIGSSSTSEYTGSLVLSYSYHGVSKKVREDAKIWIENNHAYVVCSNPLFLQGSASYDADRFDLVVKSPTQLAGKNSDAARNGGWVKMSR